MQSQQLMFCIIYCKWSDSATHFVATIKQIHFWIIKHRIALAMGFSVFIAQETHPEINTGNGSNALAKS